MFKKIVNFALCLSLIAALSSSAFAVPEIFGDAGVVINASTGQVLYDKDKDKTMYPASTTKILTCIVALENSKLEDKVTVDDKTPYDVDGGHIALQTGEVLTMDELLQALMLNSANDAAMVIGRHLGGTLEGFSDMMNAKAKEIGAVSTHCRNPSGLPDKEHVTTAHDLARMAQYGLRNGYFRYYVSKVEGYIPPNNIQHEPRYLLNSNKLLYSDKLINVDGKEVPMKYEGITGVKTGYTDDAQNCLVSSAKRGDTEYVAVVLHSNLNNVYIDSHKLLDYAFNEFSNLKFGLKDHEMDFKYKGKDLKVKLERDAAADIRNDSAVSEDTDLFKKYNVEKEFVPDEKALNGDYKENDKLGELVLKQNGAELTRTPVLAVSDKSFKTAKSIAGIKKLPSTAIASIFFFAVFIVIVFAMARSLIRRRNQRKKYK